MANIDDFKANLLGGGARPNQFRVTITPPPGIAIGLDVRRTSFLAKVQIFTVHKLLVKFQCLLEVEISMFLETESLKLGQPHLLTIRIL